MKKILALVFTVTAVFALAFLPTLASVESDMKDAVGSKSPNAQFDVNINAPADYKAGDKITVTVTVDNIADGLGLTSVEFELKYDNTKLVITNTSDGDGALNCIKKQPAGEWENLCSVVQDDGLIICGALTFGYEESAAKNNGDLTFSFDFNVNSDASGDIGLYIRHDTVYGTFNLDSDIAEYTGNGGYAVIAEQVIAESSLPESSLPESSLPESSVTESSVTESSVITSSVTESSVTESSGVISGGSSFAPETSGTSSEISDESSLAGVISTPDNSFVSFPDVSGGASSSKLPSAIGAASAIINASSTASNSGESQEDTDLPAFAVPMMIVGGILLIIFIAVIVLHIIDKKNNRTALDSVRDEVDRE